MLDLRRRQFITLLGGAAAWPLAARAQQHKLPTIGFLGGATWESEWAATFVQRLHELGWAEGRTIAIEYRWTEGRNERIVEILAEFVRLKVDVIVTYSTPPVLAAKQATSAIPIVFAAAGDPLGAGLVASLARPGGNVTGLSLLATDLAGKRIELLREVVPGLRRLAILGNVSNPLVVLEMGRYAANFPDLFRRTAGLVDKILRGVKPAEIPVEQPTKFDLVVNLTTAKALGLAIPDSFLVRADKVIE